MLSLSIRAISTREHVYLHWQSHFSSSTSPPHLCENSYLMQLQDKYGISTLLLSTLKLSTFFQLYLDTSFIALYLQYEIKVQSSVLQKNKVQQMMPYETHVTRLE